jgi:hypothetical protein
MASIGSCRGGSGKGIRRLRLCLARTDRRRYCKKRQKDPITGHLWEDPGEALKRASLNDLHRFFNWWMKQVRGKNGRRLRGTKKASSLEVDWRKFRLVYQEETGEKIDAKLNRAMHKVREHLW